ncbi:hypothetical protein B0H16DRAFT_1757807 [Mycena metata]|uniref:DUF6534 domain-containing protein n=1 Tax=Mycena metata TaxID=1033252 RepID=A0AAD7IF52_9AGAR|nr:hypothetical protein B0H16DRAFT_1757807 [Mycena metata]
MRRTSVVGIYVVILLAVVQMSAGIAQTVLSYRVRSFAKLNETMPITTLQTAASLACDIVITVYLCVFLAQNKKGLPRTEYVSRGMLTALCSGCTMILFIVSPDTFWFFLSLAPNSKCYTNSMIATLNVRDHVRNKALNNRLGGWNTVEMGEVHTNDRHSGTPAISTVGFVRTPEDNNSPVDKTAGFPSSESVAG